MNAAAVHEQEHYLNSGYGLASWLLTRDHKRVALLYFFAISVFFAIGGGMAGLMRLALLTPQGAVFSSETYNNLFTLHGVILVFFFLIPAVPATLGNFLLPLMIGARRMAFPGISLLSWYLLILGGGFAIFAMAAGGVDTGWTLYAPYSTSYSKSYVVAAVVGMLFAGASSALTGLNFIATVHRMRAPGMAWSRMPLFVWASYATGAIQVIVAPVMAITLGLVLCERLLHIGVFDPALGGDPLLFQRLFWFYAHPAVYTMVLPAMGVVSELISTFSRKAVFGYRFVASSSVALAVLGLLVWGQHLFVTGQSLYTDLGFSLLNCLIAIPAAVTVFNWLATLNKGSISFAAPTLYAFGFIGLFTVGGLAGLFLAALAMNVHVAGTYFEVAHFHYLMVGGTLTAYLGGLHYWWPKITGRMYSEGWAKLSAVSVFVGVNLTFLPQFALGYLGMPSRSHLYPDGFHVLHLTSTMGAAVLGVSCVLPAIYLGWSLGCGRVAGANPWRASGLEWKTSSPPAADNFDETPVVRQEAYDYSGAIRQ